MVRKIAAMTHCGFVPSTDVFFNLSLTLASKRFEVNQFEVFIALSLFCLQSCKTEGFYS